MFPITDVLGRIIGFGGRLLPVPQQSSETAARNVVLPKYF
jgi:DNA primase